MTTPTHNTTEEVTEEEIKSLDELLKYRASCGMLFTVERDNWDGPYLNIKVKGYEASTQFATKYLCEIDSILPRLLRAYREMKDKLENLLPDAECEAKMQEFYAKDLEAQLAQKEAALQDAILHADDFAAESKLKALQLHANECAIKLLKEELDSRNEQLKIWEERISDKNAEIEKKDEVIDELKKELSIITICNDTKALALEKKNKQLSGKLSEIEKMKAALEFYANDLNWLGSDDGYFRELRYKEHGSTRASLCLDEINGGKESQ